MGAERRLENKRMKVTKRMEISCLDTGTCYTGETEDVSDSGIRACLNKSPKAGAKVMVKLFWDESDTPVETFGRVAWTAPMPISDGIEVGLMLGAEKDVYGKKAPPKKRAATRYHKFQAAKTRHSIPFEMEAYAYDQESIENKKTLAAVAKPEIVVEDPLIPIINGESFKVRFQGVDTWAQISETGNVDHDGKLLVTLQLKEKRLWKKAPVSVSDQPTRVMAEDDMAFNPEAWKPRPITNAVLSVKKYAGPPAKIIWKLFHGIAKIGFASGYFAWKRVPLNARNRVLGTIDRVQKNPLVNHSRKMLRLTRITSAKLISRFAKQS